MIDDNMGFKMLASDIVASALDDLDKHDSTSKIKADAMKFLSSDYCEDLCQFSGVSRYYVLRKHHDKKQNGVAQKC